MERLNKIIELNTEGMYLVTEAGVLPLKFSVLPTKPVIFMQATRAAPTAA